MEIIKLRKRYYNSDFNIQVKDLNNTKIKIFSPNSRYAGLGRHYDVTIYTDIDTYYLGNIGEIREGLDNFFIEQLLEQKIFVESEKNKTENSDIDSYTLTLSKMQESSIKLINKLTGLENSNTQLRFHKITSMKKNILEIQYMGHEVGGSYVHDYEVVPSYLKVLQYESNRRVEWVGRESGGFGYDIYLFKVFIEEVLDKERENEIIRGKRYHIDSTDCGGRQSPYAFRVSAGIEWAMMYSISESLNTNKVLPNIKLKEGKIVSIYGEEVFKIVVDAWEKDDSRANSGRIHFKGTFDLFIEPNDFKTLYLKLYGELNNGVATLVYPRCVSPKIEFKGEGTLSELRNIGYL